MAMPRVLMTGATGSFGRYVAAELLARGCELVVLVHGRDDADARRRAHEAIGSPRDRLRVVRGDVAADGLGLSGPGRAAVRSVDVVLHAAAATGPGLDLDAARRVNFAGTRNLLTVAHRIPRLQKLVHVSAACVAGKRCGHVLEPELRDAGFLNANERSKYEAERLVRAHSQVLPIAVLRPSLVVEPPEAAGTSPFRLALDLVAQGLVPVLPGAPMNTLDFISAADAAAATARILLAPGALGTYHVASGDRAPQLIDVVRTAARRPVRFAAPATAAEELGRLRLLHPRAARSYEAVTPFIEALAYPKTFDTARAEAVLGGHPVSGDPLDLLVPSWPLTPSRRVSEWLSAG